MAPLSSLAELDDFGRELVKTGMCYDCQERVFHRPLPEHEEMWGKQIGECECCGSPIYDKMDGDASGLHKCSQCGEEFYGADKALVGV